MSLAVKEKPNKVGQDSAKRFIMENYVPVLMGLNLLLALVLRLYNLGDNPVGLNQDEAVNGVDAYALVHTLRDHHGNFLPPMLEAFEDWASPTLTYLTVPFVWLLGLSEFSIRLPVALAGTGAVLLMFLFMRRLTGRTDLALLSSFFLCIMPWHVIASRWAIPVNVLVFFLLLTLYTYCRATDSSPKLWKFMLVGGCAAVTAYAYPTQKMFIPLLLGSLFLADIARKIAWKPLIIKYVAIGATYLALTSPIYLLTLLDPAKYNARFNSISIFSLNSNPVLEFFRRYFGYFGPEFNFIKWGFSTGDHVAGVENTYNFLAAFYYLGFFWCLYALIARKPFIIGRPAALLLVLWAVFAPVPASLTASYNHVLREMHGLPTVIIFSVIGLVLLLDLLRKKVKPAMFYGVIVVVSGLYLVLFSLAYFRDFPANSDDVFQYGIKDYSAFLLKNEANFDSVKIDGRISLPYIYYLFYSAKDPATYNYAEINTRLTDEDGYMVVPKIGKYFFEPFNPQDLANATEIYSVKGHDGNPRYSIYALGRAWYVVRQY